MPPAMFFHKPPSKGEGLRPNNYSIWWTQAMSGRHGFSLVNSIVPDDLGLHFPLTCNGTDTLGGYKYASRRFPGCNSMLHGRSRWWEPFAAVRRFEAPSDPHIVRYNKSRLLRRRGIKPKAEMYSDQSDDRTGDGLTVLRLPTDRLPRADEGMVGRYQNKIVFLDALIVRRYQFYTVYPEILAHFGHPSDKTKYYTKHKKEMHQLADQIRRWRTFAFANFPEPRGRCQRTGWSELESKEVDDDETVTNKRLCRWRFHHRIWPNNPIPGVNTSLESVDGCQARCASSGQCGGWSWRSLAATRGPFGECELSGVGPLTVTLAYGFAAGRQCKAAALSTFLPAATECSESSGTAFAPLAMPEEFSDADKLQKARKMGFYTGATVEMTSNACASRCTVVNSCGGWTWWPGGNSGGTCYLTGLFASRTAVPPPQGNHAAAVVSGVGCRTKTRVSYWAKQADRWANFNKSFVQQGVTPNPYLKQSYDPFDFPTD